jgi:VWFA-related protein
MRFFVRHCLTPALILFGLAAVRAQTPPPAAANRPFTLKYEVRVVLVDVVVTQKKGRPAPGLRREDFQVLEDGKPQAISFFEEHTGAPAKPVELPPTTPNTYTNASAANSSDSMNVLLLDWLNTQPQDRKFVQTQIAEYLRRTPSGTSLAAFVLSSRLQMVQGFTSNPAEVLAALDNHQKSGASMRASALLPGATQAAADQQIVDMMVTMQAAPAAVQAVTNEQGDFAASQTDKRVGTTLQALQELARYLSGLPGRKNVIWFSSAFPINIFPGRDVPRQYGAELKRTADLLADSRVSIYPVSTTGMGQGFSADIQMRRGPGSAELNGNPAANQISMEALAKGTGGIAFYNTNGLSDALEHAVEVGSHYYTLTYTPTNAALDGKFRKIDVKVLHGGYKVAHRVGYYAGDAKSDAATQQSLAADTLPRLVRFGMPDIAQIPYTVTVSPKNLLSEAGEPGDGSAAPSNQPTRRYVLDFTIPPAGLKLKTSPDGVFRDSVSMMIVAYTLEGQLLNVVTREFPIALQLDDYTYARQHGVRLRGQIDVPSGDVVLHTGVTEQNSSNAGTLGIPLSESAMLAAIRQLPKGDGSSTANAGAGSMESSAAHSDAPEEATSAADHSNVAPPNLGDRSSDLNAGSPCRIEDVLPQVASHVKTFVESMNQFAATEVIERERLDRDGNPKRQVRSRSNYVAAIRDLGSGNYEVSEFRGETQGVKSFEGDLAASGSPALALIFHPTHLQEFDMTCAGLTTWRGRDAWEIRFQQRPDRPTSIGGFAIGHRNFDILLKGSAWIDSTNYQLVHLEADLLQPIPEAKLDMLHQSIDYGPVTFAARNTTLWLPDVAEITAEFRGRRLRDRHTFSDFQLFAIDTGQKIGKPDGSDPSP